MLTGVMPYNTPSPQDLEKLMRGDLVSPPRARNTRIPKKINDIVMKAIAPDVTARYQRASELLHDLLAARPRTTPTIVRTTATPAALVPTPQNVEDIQTRLKARETPVPRFCWHCRKPLHARSDRCPFCGEAQ
jgi:hypothetical protein